MRKESRGSVSETDIPQKDAHMSMEEREVVMHGKNIRKLLLTSFGLFFAGATPAKPNGEGEKEKGRRLPAEL